MQMSARQQVSDVCRSVRVWVRERVGGCGARQIWAPALRARAPQRGCGRDRGRSAPGTSPPQGWHS